MIKYLGIRKMIDQVEFGNVFAWTVRTHFLVGKNRFHVKTLILKHLVAAFLSHVILFSFLLFSHPFLLSIILLSHLSAVPVTQACAHSLLAFGALGADFFMQPLIRSVCVCGR